jgi:DNA-binding CsgD family transcriptional regulator
VARLSADDYEAVLGAVQEITGVSGRDEFGPTALRQLTTLVRSDVITLNEVDPAGARVVYLAEPGTFEFPDGSAQVFAELAHVHPLICHHAESGDGSAIKVSDFLEPDAWHANQLYRRFFAWVGVEYQMSITLPAPAPIVVGLAVNRSDTDFDERDRAVLNLVRPHLAQSWRRAREYERLEALLSAAAGALAEAGTGVIALADPVQEITPGALVSLYRFFGRPAPRDPLPGRVRGWLDAQQSPAAGLQLARPLRASLEGRQLVLRHLPGVHEHPDVILLDERPLEVAMGTLRGVGLTDREVAVVRLLGGGASNGEIARQLSLSTWTVKRHLANIYAKLGVSSRVRVAALALEIEAHHDRPPASRRSG